MKEFKFAKLDKATFLHQFFKAEPYRKIGDNDQMQTGYRLVFNDIFAGIHNPQFELLDLSKDEAKDVMDGVYSLYHGLFYETGFDVERFKNLVNICDGIVNTSQQMTSVVIDDDNAGNDFINPFTSANLKQLDTNLLPPLDPLKHESSLESYDAGLSSHGRSVHDSLADDEIPMLDDSDEENDVAKTPQSLTDQAKQALADYHQKFDIEVTPNQAGLDTTNQKSAFDLIDNTPIEDAKLPQKSAAMKRLNSLRDKRTQISQAPIMSLADLMHHKSSDNIKPKYLSQAHKPTPTKVPIKMNQDIYQTLVKLCPSIEMYNQHQISSAYQSLTKLLDQYHRRSQADDGLTTLFSFNQTYGLADLKLMLGYYAQQLASLPVNDTWVKLYAQLTAGQLELLAFFVATLKNDAGMSVNTYQVSVKKQSVNVNYAGHLIGEITGDADGLKFSFENFDDDLLNHHSFDGMDRQQKPVVKYNKFVNSPKLVPHDFTHQPQYVGAIMQVIAGYVAIGHLYKYYNNGQSK